MARNSEFGAVLTRLRQACGFASAFAFYKAREARRTLGISFPNYLKLERGGNLPQPKRLEPLISALGHELSSREANELLRAYLRCLLGSERLLSAAAGAAAADPAPQSWLLAESAARQAIGQRKVQLTLEQLRMLSGNPAAYSCHVILANTLDWMTRSELARLTGRPTAAVAAALRVLQKTALAELSGERARSPLAGSYVVPPSATPLTASVYAALQKHRAAWGGRVLHSPYLILRARGRDMDRYVQHLADVVSLSAIYGDVNPGPDSGMYLVEAKVSRLFE